VEGEEFHAASGGLGCPRWNFIVSQIGEAGSMGRERSERFVVSCERFLPKKLTKLLENVRDFSDRSDVFCKFFISRQNRARQEMHHSLQENVLKILGAGGCCWCRASSDSM
jgi:hypothetical protein